VINLGLSAADQAAFEATLRQSHRIRTTVRVLDANEQPVYTFDGTIVSGAVQVDLSQSGSKPLVKGDAYVAASGPVRTLNLTVMRPDKAPSFLPGSPGSDVVWADNFISVLYGVWVDGLSAGPGWVDVPVFWGPVTGLVQNGAQYQITASGKEVLALDPCLLWDTVNIAKGTQRTDAIKSLLTPNGEARFSFAEINSRTSVLNSYNRYTQPWIQAQSIAQGGNLQLFYDGLGRARLRPWSTNRVWLFDDGDNGCVLSRPQVTYDISKARNVVEVLGNTPSGSKTAIRAVSYADPSNPLSGESLARNGERRWMVYSQQSSVTTQADAQKLADSLLFQMLSAAIDVQFDSLVIPHLEEGDTVAVQCAGQQIEFVLEQFTLPLTSDTNMTVGENRRVAWNRRGKGSPVYLLGG
jgi:hypothetical protein